jgi:hypothetical protein
MIEWMKQMIEDLDPLPRGLPTLMSEDARSERLVDTRKSFLDRSRIDEVADKRQKGRSSLRRRQMRPKRVEAAGIDVNRHNGALLAPAAARLPAFHRQQP